MKLKVLSSSSKSNCYILTNDNGRHIILDCGIKFDKLSMEIDSFRNIDFILCSHGTERIKDNIFIHLDHTSAITDCIKRSLQVYGTHNLEPKIWHKIKNWEILCISVSHGDCPCFSYLIKVDNKILYFGTDLQEHLVQTKQQINIALVEMNYSTAIVEQRQANCEEIRENYLSHCSNETAMSWLNGLEKKPNIVVPIHISKNNNDEQIICELLKDYDFKIAKPKKEIMF